MFRIWTYIVTITGLVLFAFLEKGQIEYYPPLETWSMILGYLAFLLIGVTLLIGPVKMWLPPRFAAYCLSVRRDLGILAGFAGALHVALVLYLFDKGTKLIIFGNDTPVEDWLGLFFHSFAGEEGLYPNLSMTGIANYMGAIAFVVLLALWFTSSRRAERLLGGAGWKRLHLQNTLLFALVLFHGIIYIRSIKGAPHTLSDFLWVAVIVVVLRFVCFVYTLWKRKR